jgi:hypothetical protein
MRKITGILTLIFVFIILSISNLLAQKDIADVPIKRNSLFVEFGGQGKYMSLNIDRLFRTDKKVKSSFRLGLISDPFDTKNNVRFGVPISYNLIFGKKNSHFELGLGLTALYIKQKNIPIYDKTYNEFGELKYNNLIGS